MNIRLFVILLGQYSINFIEGLGKLFHFAIMIIHIVDNSVEQYGRDSTYFIILYHHNSFNGC
jgi:hypothetical protein